MWTTYRSWAAVLRSMIFFSICGPHLSGQCSFLKRKFVSDGHGHLWVKLNDKYISKLVEELHLGNNKGKSVPTTGQFQKGHQFKPLTEEQSRAYRTCVGVLLYMASERADIQCATRALAAKVTCPDDGDWKELKQVVLYLKDTADYVQKMSATAAMSSSLRAIRNQIAKESAVAAVHRCLRSTVTPTGLAIVRRGGQCRVLCSLSTATTSLE